MGACWRRPGRGARQTCSHLWPSRLLPPATMPSCMQTKEGNVARGLTAQDAAAEAVAIHRAAYTLYKGNPEAWGYQLRFSWDNASAHTAARDDIDLLPEQWLKLPAHSPDLHMVIERPHAWIKEAFAKELAKDPSIKSVKRGLSLLRDVVKQKVTVPRIRALIEELPLTYISVIANKGDWADKPHR